MSVDGTAEANFVYRLRPETDMEEYWRNAGRMLELVMQPEFGLVSLTEFTAGNGDRGLIGVFESWEHVRAWRDHPEHAAIQELARQDWYEWYWLGEIRRYAEFNRETGRRAVDGTR